MDMKELIAKMTAIEESAKSEKEYDHDSLDKDDIDYIDKESKKDEDDEYEEGEEDKDSDEDVKESIEHEEEESEEESEDETVKECGGEMTSMPMHSTEQQDSVSMTINMSGSGKGGIHDILDVIRNIEKGKDGLGSMGSDNSLPVGDKELNKDATMIIGTSDSHDMDSDMDDRHEESFVNEPGVKYAALKHIMPSGDDMHKSKDMYSRSQPGDNPMAIKEKLESLYKFVKYK